MTDDFRSSVFVSHSWRDKQCAHRIAGELQRCIGAHVWLDFHELLPGDPIQATIDEAIATMDLVVVVWTRSAADSPSVQAEIATALAAGVRVVPAIVEYDERGSMAAPLTAALRHADVLYVHFHHFPTGLAQLAYLVFEIESRRLPDEIPVDVAGRRMVGALRGYLEYLANYRDLMKVDDDRSYWIEQIIREIERFVRAGGDIESVRMLLDAARRSDVDDPEGIGVLVTRLEALVGAPRAETRTRTAPRSDPPREHRIMPSMTTRIRQQIGAAIADEQATGRTATALRQSHPHLQEHQVQGIVQFVEAYVRQAPDLLDAMAVAARERGALEAVQPVIEFAAAYFDEPNDLIPDAVGLFGLLDDAFFAQRFVEAISRRAMQVSGRPLVDVDLEAANHDARVLLGEQVAGAIDARVARTLQREGEGWSALGKVAIAGLAGAALLAIGSMFVGGGGHRDPDTEAALQSVTGGMFG